MQSNLQQLTNPGFADQGDEQAAPTFPQRHLGILLGQPEGAGRHHEAVCHQVSAAQGHRQRGAVTRGCQPLIEIFCFCF